jgi:hypothetical protein
MKRGFLTSPKAKKMVDQNCNDIGMSILTYHLFVFIRYLHTLAAVKGGNFLNLGPLSYGTVEGAGTHSHWVIYAQN